MTTSTADLHKRSCRNGARPANCRRPAALRVAGVLLGMIGGLLLSGCGGDDGEVVKAPAIEPDTSDKGTQPEAGTTPEAKACASADDCLSTDRRCDLEAGRCVQCLHPHHCPGFGDRCVLGNCVAAVVCKSDKQCALHDAVCDLETGLCVTCLAHGDCPQGKTCKSRHCMAPAPACKTSKECAGYGQVCDKALEQCVDCSSDDDCDTSHFCADGLCVKDLCPAGEKSCLSVAAAQTCPSNGSGFVQTPCGEGQACHQGACMEVICTPEALECDADTVVVCGKRGIDWTPKTICKAGQLCVDGACLSQLCKVGQSKCTAQGLASCNADGLGWTTQPCGAKQSCVLVSGAATCADQVCTPAESRCEGKLAQSCSGDGMAWLTVDDCAKAGPDGAAQVCLKGKCVSMTCTPGEVKCADNKTVQACNADGMGWQSTPCGAGKVCDLGKCPVMACVAGEVFCKGDLIVQCNAKGTSWTQVVDCAAGAMTCDGGKCVKEVCTVGQVKCASGENALMGCNSDQKSWSKQPCAAGTWCVAGACKPQICVPGAKGCDAKKITQCKADGLAWDPVTDCASTGQSCVGGICVTAACGDGKVNLPAEVCDDGNQVDGDGCSAGCQKEATCAPACPPGQACLGDGTCSKTCLAGKDCALGDKGSAFQAQGEGNEDVQVDANGHLGLKGSAINKKYTHIWISGTGAKVVSKTDTKTGKELGRYATCGSPSRTAVDLDGAVWVGCRVGGEVMKILPDASVCADKNGNGTIETSSGPGDLKPYGQDECVAFVTKPDAGESIIRAVAVGADNRPWVGGWNTKKLWLLDDKTGAVLSTITLGCSPYGNVIDGKGIIWVSGRGCSALLRVDPKTKQVTNLGHGGKGAPYGVTVDAFGKIWIANTNNYTSRYDPETQKWTPVGHNQRSRGVTADPLGFVYVALDTTSTIARIDAKTLTVMAHFSLGSGRYPVGVAVDFDGYVWAVNQSKSTTSKVDPGTGQVVGEYAVGNSPYTYSDMTGNLLHQFAVTKGTWRGVFYASAALNPFVQPAPQITWTTLSAEIAAPAGATVHARLRAAASAAALATANWGAPLGLFPGAGLAANLGLKGAVVEVELTLKAAASGGAPVVKSVAVDWSSK